jgi:hypothetical protein
LLVGRSALGVLVDLFSLDPAPRHLDADRCPVRVGIVAVVGNPVVIAQADPCLPWRSVDEDVFDLELQAKFNTAAEEGLELRLPAMGG